MKSRHITKILDRAGFSRLSESESAEIVEHIKDCVKCRAAFQSAQIASILLKEKSLAGSPAPAPFFQSKVLNAWRGQRIVKKPIAAFWRWWQASATLVLLMFLAVIGLIAVSLAAPPDTAGNRRDVFDANLYSAENVLLDEKPSGDLTTEQVFETLDDAY